MRLPGIGPFRGVIMAKIKLTKSAVDAAQLPPSECAAKYIKMMHLNRWGMR